MPEDQPSKKAVKEAMGVFFGPRGGDGIGLEEPPQAPPAPPAEPPAPTAPPEGEKPELDADGKPVAKKPDEPAAPPAATPPPAPAPAPVKRVAKKTTPPPNVDTDAISRVAADTAARTAAAMQKPAAPAPPGEVQLEGLELDDDDKDTIADMQMAGRANPKFANLAERTMKFWKMEKDYIDQWKSANPDKKFDQAEHEEFYAKHEPQFDQGEFKKTIKQAEREALKAEVKSEVTADSRAEVSKLRFETRWKDEAPVIDQAANESVAEMISAVDPELAKSLMVGTETVISNETLAKIEEADPVAGRIIKRQAGYLARLIREVERLDRYPGHYRGDASNPLHVTLFNAALELEDRISRQPAGDQLYDAEGGDNRVFIKQRDYNKLLDKIDEGDSTAAEKNEAVKTLEGKYWTLDAADVKSAIINKIRQHTLEKINEDRETVELAIKKRGGIATQTPPPANEPPSPAPAPARPKPPSVSGGGGEKTTTITPAPQGGGNIQEAVDQVFFR